MHLSRQNVAPDGSCLFTSIDLLLNNGALRVNVSEELRSHCATTILSSPSTYTEVYLGKTPEEYIKFIRSPHEYGGEIEIVILAQKFNVAISVVSLTTPPTVLTYGAAAAGENDEQERIFVLYNGQHYDALVQNLGEEGEPRRYIFSLAPEFDEAALVLAYDEKLKRDVILRTRQRKKLRCKCGAVVDDTAAFQTHCETVEHDDDFGYECEEILIKEMVEDPNAD